MKPDILTDIIGWASTAVLLATIGRQVYSQWKSKATAGVSRWLFIGQISASIGFTIYSYLLHNWVFLFSNAALIVTAVVGELIYISNRRRQGNESPTIAAFSPERDPRPPPSGTVSKYL